MKRNRDLEFLYEIGCFRFLQRTWRQFLNPDSQNISEHTMRVIWLALLIANKERVKDEEKIMKMALVHDLPESRTGDVNYLSRQYTKRDEDKAVKDIFEGTAFKEEYIKLWREYEKRWTIEAKIVKDADNLDVDLEILEQEIKGFKKDRWIVTREAVYKSLHTKTAKKLWHEIHTSDPHDWHLLGRNRLVAGDWKKLL